MGSLCTLSLLACAAALAACGGGESVEFEARGAAVAYIDAVDAAWRAPLPRLAGSGGVLPGDPAELDVGDLALEMHVLRDSIEEMPTIIADLHAAIADLTPPRELQSRHSRLVDALAESTERTVEFVALALPALRSNPDLFDLDEAIRTDTRLREAGAAYRDSTGAVRDAFCEIGEAASAKGIDAGFAETCDLQPGDVVR